MLAVAHAEENGTHMPSAHACRFLNAHITPFAHCGRFRAYQCRVVDHVKIVGCAGGRIQSRVSISVLYSIAPDLIDFDAPKLSACGAGIESERYDFDKISLVTFFLGKKVTSSIGFQVPNIETLSVQKGSEKPHVGSPT
jgi:hypothetical protein